MADADTTDAAGMQNANSETADDIHHTAWLAIERRHTKPDDRRVLRCVEQGWARWLPPAEGMREWRRVGLTQAGEEVYLGPRVDGDWAE